MTGAGTAIKYVKGTVRIEAILTEQESPFTELGAYSAVDMWMGGANKDRANAQLARPRQKLTFEAQGIGYLTVMGNPLLASQGNDDTVAPAFTYQDCNGGPFPKILAWKPIVSNKAAMITWEVEFYLNPAVLTANIGQLVQRCLDLTYTRTFKLNSSGAAVISTVGYLRNARTANSLASQASVMPGRTGFDSATHFDKEFVNNLFKDDIAPWGFKREQQFIESDDGAMMNFAITDTEIESDNPFQPYMINMDIHHKARSNLLQKDATKGAGLRTWENTLSGTITIPKGIPRIFSWFAFLSVYQSRTKEARKLNKTADTKNDKDETDEVGLNFIVTEIEIDEEIYGRSMAFSMRWITLCELKKFFETNAIFSPVAAYDPDNPASATAQWQAWNAQITAFVKHPEGNLRLRPLSVKVIADQEESTRLNIRDQVDVIEQYAQGLPTVPPAPKEYDNTKLEKVYGDPENEITTTKSWLNYNCGFKVRQMVDNVIYNRVEDIDVEKTRNNPASGSANTIKAGIGFKIGNHDASPFTGTNSTKIFAHTRGTFVLEVYGEAHRAKYRISPPVITDIAGKPATPIGEQIFIQERVGKGVDQPIYYARWFQRYSIEGDMFESDLMQTIEGSADPSNYT
jgi:hypothetical protein